MKLWHLAALAGVLALADGSAVRAGEPKGGCCTSACDDCITSQLKAPVTITFSNTPLRQVLRDLCEMVSVPVFVDPDALGQAGIDLDQPVSLKVEDVSFKSVLTLVLHKCKLGWLVKDDCVYITSEAAAAPPQRFISCPVFVSPMVTWGPATGTEAVKTAPCAPVVRCGGKCCCPEGTSCAAGCTPDNCCCKSAKAGKCCCPKDTPCAAGCTPDNCCCSENHATKQHDEVCISRPVAACLGAGAGSLLGCVVDHPCMGAVVGLCVGAWSGCAAESDCWTERMVPPPGAFGPPCVRCPAMPVPPPPCVCCPPPMPMPPPCVCCPPMPPLPGLPCAYGVPAPPPCAPAWTLKTGPDGICICAPGVKGSCDRVSFGGPDGCVVLEGHVRLTSDRNGQHAEVSADRICVHLGDMAILIKSGPPVPVSPVSANVDDE
jgi:hypothetical protein